MKTLYYTIGLPASGKTTWALAKIADLTKGQITRVNKDTLRSMMHSGAWSPANESEVLAARDAIVDNALSSGRHVIVDDTGFHDSHQNKMRGLALKHKARFEIVDFRNVPLETCIQRDLLREKPVGEKAILNMWTKYIRGEARPELVTDPNLPTAIICDLDGTLSKLNGRNPYDISTCENDTADELVLEAINFMSCDMVLFVSGRTVDAQGATERFLGRAYRKPYELYMRKSGDLRKDAVVKREIFDAHIRHRYNVKLVLDDRNGVVSMWRNMGLTCWQVANGDF